MHRFLVCVLMQLSLTYCMAQSSDPDAASTDSVQFVSLPDSTDNDSVVVIRTQAVVRKQVQLTHQTIIDTVYKHHLSAQVSVLQMPAVANNLNYQSAQTNWTIDQCKRYNIQFLYHRTLSKHSLLGAGISLSYLSYQLLYHNTRSQTITTRSTQTDTVEVYYIEENNVSKPHYIIRNTSVTHTDTITNTRRCDTLTRIYHLGIPINYRYPVFSNLFASISLNATIEPGLLLSARGAVAQTDSLVTYNSNTHATAQFSTELGIIASLLVTEQLSVDCSVGYRHHFLALATMLPANFMRQQLCLSFGVSYSL